MYATPIALMTGARSVPDCRRSRLLESAAHLVDHVFPVVPVRQLVLTFPYPLRFSLASQPQVLSDALAAVQRAIATFLIHKSGFTGAAGPR